MRISACVRPEEHASHRWSQVVDSRTSCPRTKRTPRGRQTNLFRLRPRPRCMPVADGPLLSELHRYTGAPALSRCSTTHRCPAALRPTAVPLLSDPPLSRSSTTHRCPASVRTQRCPAALPRCDARRRFRPPRNAATLPFRVWGEGRRRRLGCRRQPIPRRGGGRPPGGAQRPPQVRGAGTIPAVGRVPSQRCETACPR